MRTTQTVNVWQHGHDFLFSSGLPAQMTARRMHAVIHRVTY